MPQNPAHLPIYLTAHSLGVVAEVHRVTLMRLVARGHIFPDAYLDFRGDLQPLFYPEKAVQLVGLVRRTSTSPSLLPRQ